MRQRPTDETGIPADGVRDIAFLAFSHRGHLEPEEFHDMGNPGAGMSEH